MDETKINFLVQKEMKRIELQLTTAQKRWEIIEKDPRTHRKPYIPMREVIQTVENHKYLLEQFEIPLHSAFWLQMNPSYHMQRPGTFVRLVDKEKKEIVMSDTQMEQDTCIEYVNKARGEVLVAGLGIGLTLIPVLLKPEVDSVTVIEIDPYVIDLVLPQLREWFSKDEERIYCFDKLAIISNDIMQWNSVSIYDTIFFDIWNDISLDNLENMHCLHECFAEFIDPSGWMDSWMYQKLRKVEQSGDLFITPFEV